MHTEIPLFSEKLLGFIAVGPVLELNFFLFYTFLFILIGSLIEKVLRQEPQLIEIFGERIQNISKKRFLYLFLGTFLINKC